jgi:protein TonB
MSYKIKYLLLAVFFHSAITAFGQDTAYYSADWVKVNSLKEAGYYVIIQHDPDDTNRVVEKIFYNTGQVKSESNYSDYRKVTRDGKSLEYYKNGQIKEDLNYKDGKFNGQILTYWPNGKPKRMDKYEMGNLVEGKCFRSDGSDTVHYDFEIMPQFSGGVEAMYTWLEKNLKYPKKAKRKGIEGSDVVEFIVNKDGSISDVKIKNSVCEELDAEAIRVVKLMPKWEPGLQDGDPVRVMFVLPFRFSLE